MKRILIVVGCLVVLAGASMPWVNGMLMERGYRQLVDQANAMYQEQGLDMKVEILRYDRSYKTSEVEWKIILGSYSGLYGVEEITMVDRGTHGLHKAVFSSSLEKNPWYQEFISSQPSFGDPLSITTEYDLLGDIQSRFTLAPLEMMVEGEKLMVKEASMEFTCDWLLENFTASGTWEGVQVGETVNIAGISLNSDMKIVSTYIWDGIAKIHIKNIEGREGDVEVQVDDVDLDYDIGYDPVKKVLEFEVSYGVGRFSDGTEEVKDAGVTFALRGVDAIAYEEFVRMYTELLGEVFADMQGAEDDPEAMLRAIEQKLTSVGLQMAGVAEKFMKSGFEISVSDLRAGLEEGNIHGEALIRLEKDMTMAQMFPMVQQPNLIFDYLSFHSDLRIPSTLVGENPMLLEPAYPGMQTGIFVREGDDLVSKIETREKKLFINEEEFSLN